MDNNLECVFNVFLLTASLRTKLLLQCKVYLPKRSNNLFKPQFSEWTTGSSGTATLA